MTDRQALVFLPGLLCDARLWRDQAEDLADIADPIIADLTLDDSVAAMARHARQVQQQTESSRALHQCADRRTAKTQDEISFPMPRHGAIDCFRWTLADHDLAGNELLAAPPRSGLRHPQSSASAQTGAQLASQRTVTLYVQRLVDRFVRDPH